MNDNIKVAVCSRSFSKNITLRNELLKKYTKVVFNDDGLILDGELLVDFLKNSTHAIVALEKINSNVLKKLPNLKVISKYGVGLDTIDMKSMEKYKIKLGWTGGVNCRSVSELVISLAISLLRHVPESSKEIALGVWRQHIGRQLSEKTIGIVGCGFVGKDLIRLLKPFNCNILVHDIKSYNDFYARYDVHSVGLNSLLSHSDIVTLHVPLDSSTKNMITKKHILLMKKNAILINIARGGLIDEDALKGALINRDIYAAALDVFSNEPPQDMELLSLPNLVPTSHIGGSAQEAIIEMGRSAIRGLEVNRIVKG
jgi:phosphoglycerate dehydrogenase-like enzyme